MQTRFTEAQLAVPDVARANKILRSCVHCGFCTATCPSYQVLGDERDSPRGRIWLIKDMLEGGVKADATLTQHVDRCLGCLACMSTCPSGVDYAKLLHHARVHIEETYRRPWRDRALRGLLARVLPYPGRMRLALTFGRLARPLRAWIPDRRLRAILDMVPAGRRSAAGLAAGVAPAQGRRRMRVVLLEGCAQKALDGAIGPASLRVLTVLGAEVVVVKDAGCCGALTLHMGKEASGKAAATQLIATLMAEEAQGAIDAVVVNTSGCGTTIKDYGDLFRDDPDMAAPAQKVAAWAKDITEVIAALRPEGEALPPLNPEATGRRVTYHAACSLQHGQRIKELPKELLARFGFAVRLPAEGHLCCGSAGTYNLLQPEISAELRLRKQQNLAATSPEVIAAGNLGCIMQIGQGFGVPVVHTVELIDWALGGPKPAGMTSG